MTDVVADKLTDSTLGQAFAVLLKRYDIDIDPEYFGTDTDWYALTRYDTAVSVDQIGVYGTWPKSNNAIIQFRHQSLEEPYTDTDGFQRANMVDSFCVVSDWAKHLIIDPTDGQVKQPGFNGVAVAWASYHFDYDLPPEPTDSAPARPEYVYIKTKGAKLSTTALFLNLDPKEWLEHLDMTWQEWDAAPAGTSMHTYKPVNKLDDPKIRYEIYPDYKPMHVSHYEGTRKVAFGDAQKQTDLKIIGRLYKADFPLLIGGEAYVPINDGREYQWYMYYLDNISLSDYQSTGRIQTTGFPNKHLTDGHLELVQPEPPNIIEEKLEEQAQADYLEAIQQELEAEAEPDIPTNWRDTYVPLNEKREAVKYYFKEYTTVFEVDTERYVTVQADKPVMIGGTFNGPDGFLFYRPEDSVKASRWHGIPPHALRTVEEQVEYLKELYNPEVDKKTKLETGLGRLTWFERYVQRPLYKQAARAYVRKENKQNKSKEIK